MSRISIDVTPEEHQRLKAIAALCGKSIKEYVIERTLGAEGSTSEDAALDELEALLDSRIGEKKRKRSNRQTVSQIFKGAQRKLQDR